MTIRGIGSIGFLALLGARSVAAAPPVPRTLEFQFTPTARAQIAIWIERPSEGSELNPGTFLQTVKLTQGVSLRGIGNRPGASQMNSAYHWPYGRREGALPVWAHRRAAAPGAAQFRRVIFQNRTSEGFASRTSEDSTSESYFCLSFTAAAGRREALDAITCATMTVPQTDKGRYMMPSDVSAGYAEPIESGGVGTMLKMGLESLYPPRRDVMPCAQPCIDRPDVAQFDADARKVMPDIDTVTMATPAPDVEQSVLFSVPNDWENGDYVAFVEVNVEGDYNDVFNPNSYPTPRAPTSQWDTWAITTGYPYRGQPSVVYRVPFTLGDGVMSASALSPAGFGDVHGFGPEGGKVHAMDPGMITDDPGKAAGSGADRLRLMGPKNYRVRVSLGGGEECLAGGPPAAPSGVSAAVDTDVKHSHEWGLLQFVVPTSSRPIHHFEVKVDDRPIVDDDPKSFDQAMPAVAASTENERLIVPTDRPAGSTVDVRFGGMRPLKTYYVAIRAVDRCNQPGPHRVTQLATTKINFTKLSGCFVATAAYGSPIEPGVSSLRTVRDYLRARSSVAATLVDLYYRAGPAAADVISSSDTARAMVRSFLAPVVELSGALSASPLAR